MLCYIFSQSWLGQSVHTMTIILGKDATCNKGPFHKMDVILFLKQPEHSKAKNWPERCMFLLTVKAKTRFKLYER